MRVEISHFDNPQQLADELARKYGLPRDSFKRVEGGKIVIELDSDEEWRLRDEQFFKDDVEGGKFVHECKITP